MMIFDTECSLFDDLITMFSKRSSAMTMLLEAFVAGWLLVPVSPHVRKILCSSLMLEYSVAYPQREI